MKKYFWIFLMICTSLISCEDESTNDDDNIEPIVETPTYFIEGKVNGELIRAEYICPYSGCAQACGYYDSGFEWVYMERTISATDQKGWTILLNNVVMDTWNVPDTIQVGNPSEQIDLELSYYSGPHESDNNFTTDDVSLGENSFSIIVTSKTNNVIEGTFSGTLRNGSDIENQVTVTEGKFKIKLTNL